MASSLAGSFRHCDFPIPSYRYHPERDEDFAADDRLRNSYDEYADEEMTECTDEDIGSDSDENIGDHVEVDGCSDEESYRYTNEDGDFFVVDEADTSMDDDNGDFFLSMIPPSMTTLFQR